MTHLKRIASPKSWITPRKGTKYILRPYPGKILAMPLGILVRDLLKLTSIKKETRAFLKNKEMLVNGKVVEEEKFPIGLFDSIAVKSIGKFYRVIINDKGKFDLNEIKENEISQKVCKVMNKVSLKKGKLQLNLFNGMNILSNKKVNVNDSLIIDTQKKAILKHIPLKEGSKAYIMGGKHLGHLGIIKKLVGKYAKVKIGDKNFEIPLTKIYVLE